MSLPNPSMSFSPFAILTAEEMNDLVENIESLADGTGFDNGAIATSDIADTAITLAKLNSNVFTKTSLIVTPASGFTIAGNVYTMMDNTFIGGYLQVTGNFTTSETAVGTISMPGGVTPALVAIFRGGVDGSSTRVPIAFITASTGVITVQAPESYTGSVWFTFFNIYKS